MPEGLIADADGDLLGTGLNSVFEIAKTPTGYASTATVLAGFNGFDGNGSEGSLLADANGDLFRNEIAEVGESRIRRFFQK